MAEPGERLKVFVSYSRADLAFADELAAGLDVMGFHPLIDRHGIREGEDWKTRLGHLIAEAGTIVFVLSPDSARSSVCEWEVEEAAKLSKRIMPALWRGLAERPISRQRDGTPWPAGPDAAPARLAALHQVRFDLDEDGKPRSFMEGLKALSKALNTDLDWLNEHTRLLSRALEWDRGERAANRLMSGRDIEDAKAWAARRPRNAPELTALHLDYIKASEDAEALKLDTAKKELAERERLAREREEAAQQAEVAQKDRLAALAQAEAAAKETAQTQKRNGRLLWGVAALVLAIFAGTIWQARETAKREALVYTSLAAQAYKDDQFERGMRYALQGYSMTGEWPWSPHSTALEGKVAGGPMMTRLQQSLRGHTRSITATAFSPDGKRVVTASFDNTARLWDAETGQEIAVLKAHTDTVRAASFSPDGKRVVTASSDQTARLWDAETGQEIAVLKAHESAVNAASFSPDGKRVVTASDDQTARLWDAETGQEIAVLKAHVGAANGASFSPDGRRIVTAGNDRVARIWDVEWVLVYGPKLRERVCREMLEAKHETEFTTPELDDPILSSIDSLDPVARNPCLRRGPLSWEYYTQAFARWSRWIGQYLTWPKREVAALPSPSS